MVWGQHNRPLLLTAAELLGEGACLAKSAHASGEPSKLGWAGLGQPGVLSVAAAATATPPPAKRTSQSVASCRRLCSSEMTCTMSRRGRLGCTASFSAAGTEQASGTGCDNRRRQAVRARICRALSGIKKATQCTS